MSKFNFIAMAQWYIEGRRWYGFAGYEANKAKWKDPEICEQKDLSGKEFIVTGANSGIGFATATELAKRNATVYMVCRDQTRGEEARQKILEQIVDQKPRVQLYLADFGSIESIKQFAEEFKKDHTKVDVLINNAGALFPEEKRTPEGVELSMAVSMGGTYLLTGLLFPLLKEAKGRVINVSSGGQYLVKLDPKDFEGSSRTGETYDGAVAYSYAKRGQVELTRKWVEETKGSGVTFHSMHPGWAYTPAVVNSLDSFTKKHKHMMRNPEQGADTIVWLAIADEPNQTNGRFWLDRHEVKTDMYLAGTACTDADRDSFWRKCAEYYKFEFTQ
jgi:dehydrogenase/reductase SDR family protein 12